MLTTITYTQSASLTRDSAAPTVVRDDTTYLFLDDSTPEVPPTAAQNGQTNGSTDQTNGNAGLSSLDENGFEIVDQPASSSAEIKPAAQSEAMSVPSRKGKEKEQYKLLAVRPANTALALLQNLMSPFVMGFAKSSKGVSVVLHHFRHCWSSNAHDCRRRAPIPAPPQTSHQHLYLANLCSSPRTLSHQSHHPRLHSRSQSTTYHPRLPRTFF